MQLSAFRSLSGMPFKRHMQLEDRQMIRRSPDRDIPLGTAFFVCDISEDASIPEIVLMVVD